MTKKMFLAGILIFLLVKLFYSSGYRGVADMWEINGVYYVQLDNGFVYEASICSRDTDLPSRGVIYRALGLDLPFGNLPTHFMISCRPGNTITDRGGPLPN
jgi:hypothetical protein